MKLSRLNIVIDLSEVKNEWGAFHSARERERDSERERERERESERERERESERERERERERVVRKCKPL